MTKLYTSICTLAVSAIFLVASGCSSAPKKDMGMAAETKAPAVTYTVEKGDTLYKISRKFNVPVADLIDTNNISNPNVIKEGTVLSIPE